jgi:hypothetical protein
VPTSGTNLRLEVSINGNVEIVAGLVELGVLDLNLSWVRRDPARATAEVQSLPGYTTESWRGGVPEVSVSALDVTRSLNVQWLDRELSIGDILTVRVLPPGEIDEPREQKPASVPTPRQGAPGPVASPPPE